MNRDGGDDEAEKRRRKEGAKLLAMFDGLTDPGPVVNGLNAGKQPVQLNSVVPVMPIIGVRARDVMSSNFEEWMKMVTENVSVKFLNGSILALLATNQTIFFVDRKSMRTIPGISL